MIYPISYNITLRKLKNYYLTTFHNMNTNNKQKAVNAIWENPNIAFNAEFNKARSGKYWGVAKSETYEAGKIRLALTANNDNITVMYNGDSRQEYTDVFTYLGERHYNTNGYNETLRHIAKLYGFSLEFSEEELKRMRQIRLANEIADVLVKYLNEHPKGITAHYLRERRKIENDGKHFGELNAESLQMVKERLKERKIKYDYKDLEALGIKQTYIDNGYTCVIPYFVNGKVVGFVLRNTNPDCGPKNRYRYSDGLGRGGYSDALVYGEPAVIVEGQFDAIRLIQAGVKNVIAFGGSKIGEDIARLLKSHGITDVIYIPDLEYNLNKEKIENLITDAVKSLQAANVEGEPVIQSLYIAEIPEPEDMFTNEKYKQYKDSILHKYKLDVDTYGNINGTEDVRALSKQYIPSWEYELNQLLKWGVEQEDRDGVLTTITVNSFQQRFNDIYTRCVSPYERQRLRDNVCKGDYKDLYAVFGITLRSIEDIDHWKQIEEYNNRIKDGTNALNKAVAEGANPVAISKALTKLNNALSTNDRQEWEKQINSTFEDDLESLKQQPETIRTKWKLGYIKNNSKKEFITTSWVEFYPADITVFCAPTSHGKTMILQQTVLDLIKTTNKTYLYVSCEENKRQLLERSLNVYIDIPISEEDNTNPNGYKTYFKAGTRKRTIKNVLRGDLTPYDYNNSTNLELYKRLEVEIKKQVEEYKTNVYPRLRFIHTEGTAESIAANVKHYINEFMERGIEIGAVFIDYMQLLTSATNNFSRMDELKVVCKVLKGIAAETELPIVIAAQLNRKALTDGIDSITVANIGEGADIERIAHDIYLVLQVDKVREGKEATERWKRITHPGSEGVTLKENNLYIEHLKARDGKTGGWGLFPYVGERGTIGEIDEDIMKI